MKEMMNLREKIYLLMYRKPDYVSNISRIIYQKRSRSIDRTVRKLKENGWVKEIAYKPPTEPWDARMSKGTYYIADMKILFDSILRDLEKKNISLTTEEKKSLKRYLDSESFKNVVQEIILVDGKLRSSNIGFSTVKRNLCYLSAYMIFITRWTDGRVIKANLIEPLMKRITHPISTLESSLWKKLVFLDIYTSSLALASFDDIRDMIESVFEPVLKEHTGKINISDIKKLRKKGTKGFFLRLEGDPDGNADFKIIDEKEID